MSTLPPLDRTSGGAPPPASWLAFFLLLLVLGTLQSTLAFRLTFWGAQPDFLLTLALVAALLSDSRTGCLTGFAGGLVTAALVGQTAGTFLVSRTVAGCVAGALTARLFRGNLGVVLLVTFLASLVAEVVYALAAPPRMELLEWLRAAGVGSAMNALLALPLAYLLRRCGWGRGRL